MASFIHKHGVTNLIEKEEEEEAAAAESLVPALPLGGVTLGQGTDPSVTQLSYQNSPVGST